MHKLSALLVAALVGAGCASPREQKDGTTKVAPTAKVSPPSQLKAGKDLPKPAPVIEPISVFSGKVVFVNAALKYTVVEGIIGRLPPVEQSLNVYRDGQKVGVIVVSNQARGANFAADLTQGEARVGDTVRSD